VPGWSRLGGQLPSATLLNILAGDDLGAAPMLGAWSALVAVRAGREWLWSGVEAEWRIDAPERQGGSG